MPFYTFHCKQCGYYEEWYQSIQAYTGFSLCPGCQTEAKRVFLPPNIISSDPGLRKRIESGMEPRIVSRENLPKAAPIRKKTAVSRPWQAGH